jgi:hypothetical protein
LLERKHPVNKKGFLKTKLNTQARKHIFLTTFAGDEISIAMSNCKLIDCYSTVTDLAKFLGWSTSVPRKTAT